MNLDDWIELQQEIEAGLEEEFKEQERAAKGLPPKPKWPPLNPDDDQIPFGDCIREGAQ